MLERWEREGTFEPLRERNRGARAYSLLRRSDHSEQPDGRPPRLGPHLKDIWQRYHAMRGCDQRYQNGFDCQGLWVEVEVEKALGLNSKREIEAYGLDRFAEPAASGCEYAGVQTEQSNAARPVDGLGPVVLHDDRHQHQLHLVVPEALPGAGLAVQGHRVDALVHALRHVALAARADRLLPGDHPPSLFVRLPLDGPRREYLVVWTTTPWTLPGQRRGRRQPDADYARVRDAGGDRLRGRGAARATSAARAGARHGHGLRAGRAGPTSARSTSCPRSRASSTGWSPGTTCRWRRAPASSTSRPAAARRTSSSASREGLATLVPVDEAGDFTPEFGWLHGHHHGRRGPADRRGPRPARRGWSTPARSPTATPSAGAAAPS